MARLSVVLTQILSVAGSAVASHHAPQNTTVCARVEAPASLTWLLQDQPFEQEDPSSFFYVNQDIDASGKKANRVAQLVTFGATLEADENLTECRLLFTMPEDSESWELIQREGSAELKVFQVPDSKANNAVPEQRNLIGAFRVRPGTQAIHLGTCDGSGSFVFELEGAGRSRLAFRQAPRPKDGFGVFMGTGCPAQERSRTEEL
ncbi:hypothetical protein Cob_v002615 [Colletotrichum orbiculare MAFF 240422]|uniref:Ubiquitin 3 binding protein But2 C-terminal domain-containing protein n=1 Tax=Colletotrichum orbiculare (strain 104-T / ATCC 96160 / CBS 514.97 / LARS 414 / MAFF 240422) TaxID=1213857 RepID=N4V387_COLOR|nr:hypothetical protein Cob_v002615 [Colletotrichum orbiculare MAFF 240422]